MIKELQAECVKVRKEQDAARKKESASLLAAAPLASPSSLSLLLPPPFDPERDGGPLGIATALLAPWIAPFNPVKTSWTLIRKAPSWAHWMGTDEDGRDVLSRVIWGARASMMAGVVSVAIAAGIGVPSGLIAGFLGGRTDMVLSRIVDAMLAVPNLILAIALAAFLGPSLENAMIAIGVTAAPVFMRVSRGAAMDVITYEYIEAARALGPYSHAP